MLKDGFGFFALGGLIDHCDIALVTHVHINDSLVVHHDGLGHDGDHQKYCEQAAEDLPDQLAMGLLFFCNFFHGIRVFSLSFKKWAAAYCYTAARKGRIRE